MKNIYKTITVAMLFHIGLVNNVNASNEEFSVLSSSTSSINRKTDHFGLSKFYEDKGIDVDLETLGCADRCYLALENINLSIKEISQKNETILGKDRQSTFAHFLDLFSHKKQETPLEDFLNEAAKGIFHLPSTKHLAVFIQDLATISTEAYTVFVNNVNALDPFSKNGIALKDQIKEGMDNLCRIRMAVTDYMKAKINELFKDNQQIENIAILAVESKLQIEPGIEQLPFLTKMIEKAKLEK